MKQIIRSMLLFIILLFMCDVHIQGSESRSTNPASTSNRGSGYAGVRSKYQIGQYAEGGVVIWLTADGQHGLVAAIEDATNLNGIAWANGVYEDSPTNAIYNDSLPLMYSLATPALNYAGGKNQMILNLLIDGDNLPAAQVAKNYSYTDLPSGITYTDWFLPASSELSCMYAMRDVINNIATAQGGTPLRNGDEELYWSSSEDNDVEEDPDSELAWILQVEDGTQGDVEKYVPCYVRCVRAF